MAQKYSGVGHAELYETDNTFQVTQEDTVLERIIVIAGAIDVYDDSSANNNQVLKGIDSSHECGIYLENGLRIVTSGGANITVVYSMRN